MDRNRRSLLAAIGLAPLAFAATRAVAAGPALETCPDPASLTFAQKTRRRSIAYSEPSTDAARQCRLCAFFTPVCDGATCGACQLLSGGAVAPNGVCASFAAKAP
jgi:High potential iron-sulfur protein